VGDSEQSIGYLAPYVFKVAITDSRIVGVKNREVTFRYKKGKNSRWREMTLCVMEFIRRFLQDLLIVLIGDSDLLRFVCAVMRKLLHAIHGMLKSAAVFDDSLFYRVIK